MKHIFLTFIISLSIFCYGQKQYWTHAELINSDGVSIHKWKANTSTQIIDQEDNKDILVVCSDDAKVLQMICPSSIFDISKIRSFYQTGLPELAKGDSTQTIYKVDFNAINYPEQVMLFTDNSYTFLMFLTYKSSAIVLHNDITVPSPTLDKPKKRKKK